MNEYMRSLLIGGLATMIYESPDAARQRRKSMLKMRTGREPWHRIQLSKAERRGKTPDEIRELRIQKWERQQQEDSAL
jgi:hypothetical protein